MLTHCSLYSLHLLCLFSGAPWPPPLLSDALLASELIFKSWLPLWASHSPLYIHQPGSVSLFRPHLPFCVLGGPHVTALFWGRDEKIVRPLSLCVCMPGIEPTALHMLSTSSITKLYPQSLGLDVLKLWTKYLLDYLVPKHLRWILVYFPLFFVYYHFSCFFDVVWSLVKNGIIFPFIIKILLVGLRV